MSKETDYRGTYEDLIISAIGGVRVAALSLTTQEQIVDLMSKRLEPVVFDKTTAKLEGVATISAPLVETVINCGFPALRTKAGWQVLNYEVTQGFRLEASNRDIIIKGGMRALAKICGAKRELIKNILMCQAHVELHPLPGFPVRGYGLVRSRVIDRPGRGRGKDLVLTLSDEILDCHSQNVSRSTRLGRDSRKLVPQLPLGPLVGRPNEHGAQATFQKGLLCAIRRGASQLHDQGGVTITKDDINVLADRCGLASTLVARVMKALVSEGGDVPPILELVSPNVYHISRHYNDERLFIEKGSEPKKGSTSG